MKGERESARAVHLLARENMGGEKMKVWKILTLTMVLVSIAAPFVAGFAGWLPRAVFALVVELAPPAAAALALVVYFDWRARVKSRILGNARRDEELATAN